MAHGEVLVSCQNCDYKSSIPVAVLQHDQYHCSRCGNHITLGAVNVNFDNTGPRAPRSRSKRPFRKRKRR